MSTRRPQPNLPLKDDYVSREIASEYLRKYYPDPSTLKRRLGRIWGALDRCTQRYGIVFDGYCRNCGAEVVEHRSTILRKCVVDSYLQLVFHKESLLQNADEFFERDLPKISKSIKADFGLLIHELTKEV